MKRAGGRRYYRPGDVVVLRGIRHLLYDDGYTIKGVQRLLKERGIKDFREVRAETDETLRDVTPSLSEELPVLFDGGPAAPDPASVDVVSLGGLGTNLARTDLAALRDAVAIIEGCEQILKALRPSGPGGKAIAG